MSAEGQRLRPTTSQSKVKVGRQGPNERTQMFNWMLDKGLSPKEIIELAKKQ